MDKPRMRFDAFLAFRGWTQTDFAARLELHQTFVSQILGGSRWPGRRAAHAIERETADWPDGPIRSVEWDQAEDVQRAADGVPRAKADGK